MTASPAPGAASRLRPHLRAPVDLPTKRVSPERHAPGRQRLNPSAAGGRQPGPCGRRCGPYSCATSSEHAHSGQPLVAPCTLGEHLCGTDQLGPSVSICAGAERHAGSQSVDLRSGTTGSGHRLTVGLFVAGGRLMPPGSWGTVLQWQAAMGLHLGVETINGVRAKPRGVPGQGAEGPAASGAVTGTDSPPGRRDRAAGWDQHAVIAPAARGPICCRASRWSPIQLPHPGVGLKG